MKFDAAIVGGDVITGTWHAQVNIGVRNGRIACLTNEPIDGATMIDASGLTVLPGAIDAHTHFRDPAHLEKEDFTSGTRAAAAGGITTVLEMPMSDVGVSTAARFERRLGLVRPKAVIDFGLYGGAGQQNVEDIPGLAAAGAIGFKTFMREPYLARATNFEGTWVTDDGALYRIAREMARTGLLWSVHAENYAIVDALQALAEADGTDMRAEAFADVRPAFVEREAVAKLIEYAGEWRARLHIAHLTTRQSLDLVRDARRRGLEVTAEACLPHLAFTEESIVPLGPLGHFTPRLRTADDRDALWEGIIDGSITLIASDHASYTRQDVEAGWGGAGFSSIAVTAGSASTEYLLPIVLHTALERNLPLEPVVAALTERPARLFGLSPRKGSLVVGADADITVVDLANTRRLDASKMQSKAKLSVFDGWDVRGVPVHTLSRGRLVVTDSAVVGQPGAGVFLTPDTGPRRSLVL